MQVTKEMYTTLFKGISVAEDALEEILVLSKKLQAEAENLYIQEKQKPRLWA